MAIDFAGTKRIYGRFHPDEPPAPGEYVDFNGLRGDPVIEPLAAEIAFADRPLTRLFSGGRGVGKTELRRLEKIFENDGYTVVFMDADSSIDVNNADFPDVLVFMALHLIQELSETRKLEPFANAVRAAREKLGETLRVINPTVDPKGVELSVGVAKLGFNLRQRRTGEENLREQAEALTNDALQAFRELVGALKAAVKARDGAGLVLILDGTDKILPPSAEGKTDQQERLFVQRAAQLSPPRSRFVTRRKSRASTRRRAANPPSCPRFACAIPRRATALDTKNSSRWWRSGFARRASRFRRCLSQRPWNG